MKLTKDQTVAIVGLSLAALGFAYASAKTKSTPKLKNYYQPGQRFIAPSGTQVVIRLPRGQYTFVGDTISQIATHDVGTSTDVVIAIPSTVLPYTAQPTWIPVNDPSRTYQVTIDVKPLPPKPMP